MYRTEIKYMEIDKMWTLAIGEYLVWYWLFITGVIITTLIATYIHKKILPLMWGIILSLVMIIGYQYIEPMLLGWIIYYNTDWILFSITAYVSVIWFGWVLLSLYNSIRYGVVVD